MTKQDKRAKKKQLSSKFTSSTLRGVIRINPRGFGFLQVEGAGEDVFIPKHLTLGAIDGDTVEVESTPPMMPEKGPEGKVIAIVSRGHSTLFGTVSQVTHQGLVVHVPLLGNDKAATLKLQKDDPAIGLHDRILMKILSWGADDENPVCTLHKKIGSLSDPSIDIECAVHEYGIGDAFPEECIEQARAWGKTVPVKNMKGRTDLRELETFTIDPDTAKDFDDALSLSKDAKGYHLGVHIADVSFYVQQDSALDRAARARGNSTYFPGKCLPMIPSELSDHLCSLRAKVNRLTVSVLIDFDLQGEMIDYQIMRSVIRSRKRFTYREVKKILDNKLENPHRDTLELMVELCDLLKQQRRQRGSVEFALPELVIKVDEKGAPVGTDYVEYDVTHQLVEEFMLKANETVARHLTDKGKGLPYRVHDEPAEENMRDFALLAQTFGFHLPLKPSPQDIQKLFAEAIHTSYGEYLATSYIRRMKLASYSPLNVGHYGLSLTHYCHFTSPIRRYVDLVAHRLLFSPALTEQELDEIASHCSERERISSKAESSVIILKKYRYLQSLIQPDPTRAFEALITRVKPFGIYFEIKDLMLEGFLHISEIGRDYYVFDEPSQQITGSRSREAFKSGLPIQVYVEALDLVRCECKWARVTSSEESHTKRPFRKKSRGRRRR